MQAQVIASDNTSSGNDGAFIQFMYKGNHQRIPLKDILYIESNARKCIIHSSTDKDKTECFYGKLSEIAKSLYPYGFVRCHQSYLISITPNARYSDNMIYIEDTSIPVSEKYRKNIISIFRQPPDNAPTLQKTVTGALVCIKGDYYGSIVRMYPNEKCTIGRDNKSSDIIINLPYISRSHCDIIYKPDNTYELIDRSHNGTYVIQENGHAEKLTPDKIHTLPSGSVICFGDRELQYRLI